VQEKNELHMAESEWGIQVLLFQIWLLSDLVQKVLSKMENGFHRKQHA
jgi:hypothetical protein